MRRLLALLALPLAAAVAEAQETTVDPGMSRAQVEAQLGKPLSARQVGSFVYLFYPNGAELRHGMHDLVILQDDKVVDAIFRSPRRRYSGASSSPTGVKAEPTLGPIQVAPPTAAPARQGGRAHV